MVSRRAVKARILGLSLLDVAIDVLVPTLLALLLTVLGMTPYLALTVGGIVIGAKAALGSVAAWRADRTTGWVVAAALLALVLLFGLDAAGVPDLLAAGAAGVVTAVPVLVTLLGRGRRVDGIGLLVLLEIAAGIVVTLISDDPRFVLARPAIYTAVAGVAALVSCLPGRRPIVMDASRPMAVAGDPARADAFEAAWTHSPAFRVIERAMTVGLGVVLLAESVLRVVVVYGADRPDIAVTGLAAQVPGIALIVVWLLAVRVLAVPRLQRIVSGYLPSEGREGAERR